MKKLIVFYALLTSVIPFLSAQVPFSTAVDKSVSKNKQQLPLIPYPKSLSLKKGYFSVHPVKTIFVQSDSLKKEALFLQQLLKEKGIYTTIKNKKDKNDGPSIVLIQTNDNAQEAYQLVVDKNNITIKSGSSTGIFYGIQTLKQLIGNRQIIEQVEINDQPAFGWRGYMVDVGRNFQSLPLLKQQIDIMAAYKLNIFHIHLTEDIAWRIAIKKYPQLTDPKTMIRNKGQFYTAAEFKELINYCKERHITLVPEIDMPGHSAAFKRAMAVDMQSDTGMVILKNILKEFCNTYNLPYLHIGADEVKISNQIFIPEMTNFIESMGKKTIGWEPGGNFKSSTIRQLWMDDAGLTKENNTIKFIDSRHLYLNHMDPLESVVTLFNRQLCNVNQGNATALGATLCLWPDRAVAKEEDAILMNAVYPAMLTFAERAWLGGGYPDWVANLGANGEVAAAAFEQFETRLLSHQKRYFLNLPFPYLAQAKLNWKFYGPFANEGELSKKFSPESASFKQEKEQANFIAKGGTIILRHWWAPKIKGVLTHPKENTTWYAVTKIWSAQARMKDFWIGFNNISRSPATDSPLTGTWDNHKSEIWLNGKIVAPPQWINAGKKGNSEIPLVDEGYEYRKPTRLFLKKGWNEIKVKLPIGNFKGKDWHNPEKWMFTVVQLP